MTQQSKTEAVFGRSAELLQQGATDQWLELFDEDAVLEFPFAASGTPSRVEGKAALADHVTRRAQRMATPKIERLKVRITEDPTTIVAEMSLSGTEGRTRPAIAVVVVVVRDGLITLYRDYWNPLDLAV
jgi:ketosteroid isomerase-like protein